MTDSASISSKRALLQKIADQLDVPMDMFFRSRHPGVMQESYEEELIRLFRSLGSEDQQADVLTFIRMMAKRVAPQKI